MKKNFNIDRDSIPLEEQKIIFNKPAEEISSEFKNLEKNINLDNLICKYKTEKISSREFRDYQNPIKLSKDLTNGNINPKEVLKDQTNFESDLGKIKKGNKKSKSKDQIRVIRHIENFSDLREKIIDSFRDNISFAIRG